MSNTVLCFEQGVCKREKFQLPCTVPVEDRKTKHQHAQQQLTCFESSAVQCSTVQYSTRGTGLYFKNQSVQSITLHNLQSTIYQQCHIFIMTIEAMRFTILASAFASPQKTNKPSPWVHTATDTRSEGTI